VNHAGAPYQGAAFCLLTRHGKERVIAPMFGDALGAEVRLVDTFDTDTLGTFTRDVPRPGTQLDAARRKARLGIELSGIPLGLASEGAFVPGPFGLYTTDIELVVLVDLARGLEIVGRASAPGRHALARVARRADLESGARGLGFPEHGLVVRPTSENDPRMVKGITSWDALEAAFEHAHRLSPSGLVVLENDLRAHLHPSRMTNIAAAAADLVARMGSPCPSCGAPGFGRTGAVPGLPCGDCGEPTGQRRASQLGCVACPHTEERDLVHGVADPARCEVCNP
jgi:hypothetical protein